VDFSGPLFGADEEAVEGIDDGIAAGLILRVARRQENNRIAVDGVSFQIPFQGSP
jgi:hypothetical protein